MEQQTFADGIGRIAIIDGIVRLDLIAHSPTETGPDGKPRAVFSHRVVMGVDQFLRAAEKIAETVKVINANARHAATPVPAMAQEPPREAARPASQPQQVPSHLRRESIHPDRPAPAPAAQRPFP
jgi:nicotinamidase-related amidase